MSSSISYLCTRATFKQVSDHIPVTKLRPAEKVDAPEVFEKRKQELVSDLMRKAKQLEFLIESLPVAEPEDEQAKRLTSLQEEMDIANEEYRQAVDRARDLHAQFSDVLKIMLCEKDDES